MGLVKKYLRKDGYRVIHDQTTDYYENQHRSIAYQKIYHKNRKKYPLPFNAYDVHHKNRNRQDNRPCNLELIPKKEHSEFHRQKTQKR